jgi:tetratricopeptide (TPR) repeat protein
VPRVTVAGGRLSLTLQLVEPKRRDVVWSGDFDGPIDRYADALVKAADALSLALTGRQTGRPAPSSASASALELAIGRGEYYGRTFNNKYERRDYDLAQAAYREALQIDPRSAAAAAGLAYLEIFRMQGGESPERTLPGVDAWAHRATDFDPRYALGWAARAVAESWRARPDPVEQLDYGFRAASLGEACGSCQLALLEGTQQFSLTLTHYIARHESEVSPLSAYGEMNDAVALTALGRAEEAKAAIARAAAIEPDARWVSVIRTLTNAAVGSLPDAAAEADALRAQDRLRAMPPFVAPMFDLISAEAEHDARSSAEAVRRLGAPVRRGAATLFEKEYLATFATLTLVRGGHPHLATTLLADVTAANGPAPYDMFIVNPLLKPLLEDKRAQDAVAQSRSQFELLLGAIRVARSTGSFPQYLERPLQEVLSLSH